MGRSMYSVWRRMFDGTGALSARSRLQGAKLRAEPSAPASGCWKGGARFGALTAAISIAITAVAAFGQSAPVDSPVPGSATRQTDRQRTEPAKPGPVNPTQLLAIRRVYVDRLSGGETAGQMRDMIIASLENSRLFVITENPDRADAVLRGSAEDLVFNDTFQYSEGLTARAQTGTSSGSSEGAAVGSNRTSSSVRGSLSLGASVGEQESGRTVERKHEANAAVRLVNKDGDVIWSTTQESLGGKFRGASADVAEKITRQLLIDYEHAKRLSAASVDR